MLGVELRSEFLQDPKIDSMLVLFGIEDFRYTNYGIPFATQKAIDKH